MADVLLEISSGNTKLAYGERLELDFKVSSLVARPLYIVEPTDGWVGIQVNATDNVQLTLAVPEAPWGMYYYAFDMPEMKLLNPGTTMALKKAIALPPRESYLDADGSVSERELEVHGLVALHAQIGYMDGFPILGSHDPWAEFYSAQLLSEVAKWDIEIDAPSP